MARRSTGLFHRLSLGRFRGPVAQLERAPGYATWAKSARGVSRNADTNLVIGLLRRKDKPVMTCGLQGRVQTAILF